MIELNSSFCVLAKLNPSTIRSLIKGLSGFFVYIDSFNDCSIDLIIYCFTVETDWETWLAHKDRLTIAIKEIVENAGTAFAFPSVSIYQEVQAQGMVANPPVDMTVNKEET